MDYVKVANGRFKARRDGTVVRLEKDGTYRQPPINMTSKDRKYQVTSFTENGVQDTYYIHHLIAEAFVPNPEGKEQILFVDGNQDNVNIDNLKWVTPKELYEHTRSRGNIKTRANAGKECVTCDNLVLHTDQCVDCQNNYSTLARQLNKKERLKNEWGEYYENIDMYKDLYQRTIIGRYQGKTLQEIGVSEGVSREAIRRRLVSVKKGQSSAFVKKEV